MTDQDRRESMKGILTCGALMAVAMIVLVLALAPTV